MRKTTSRDLWMAGCGLLVLAGLAGCWSLADREDILAPVAPPGAQVSKPPPGGGGPREIAFLQSVRKTGQSLRAMAVDGSNVATLYCPGQFS